MRRATPLLVLFLTGLLSCQSEAPTELVIQDIPPQPLVKGGGEGATVSSATANPVVHSVSVGGADACEALGLPTGCDASFSLVANQYADGSVRGEYEDVVRGAGPTTPVHIRIDCMYVAGNEAWLSGVVTTPQFAGMPVVTRVVDNGTSSNDPFDQISFSFFDDATSCLEAPDLPLVDLHKGQVRVR